MFQRPVHFALLLFALLALACSVPEPATETEPGGAPPRLASMSPALTEMLFSMGLGAQVVGVTRYCQLPAGEQRPLLGDAISVSAEAILAVEPDLLLIQSDAARFEPVEQLDPELQVEHFSIETLADISSALRRAATLAGQPALGEQAAQDFEAGLQAVRRRVAQQAPPSVLFVTGSDKPGTAGQGTFIHELIELAGGTNAAASYEGWATLNLEYALAAQPEVLLCWTVPDVAQQDLARWQALEDLPAARSGRVHVVTEPSWTLPTPGLLLHAQQLAAMLHPAAQGGAGG